MHDAVHLSSRERFRFLITASKALIGAPSTGIKRLSETNAQTGAHSVFEGVSHSEAGRTSLQLPGPSARVVADDGDFFVLLQVTRDAKVCSRSQPRISPKELVTLPNATGLQQSAGPPNKGKPSMFVFVVFMHAMGSAQRPTFTARFAFPTAHKSRVCSERIGIDRNRRKFCQLSSGR